MTFQDQAVRQISTEYDLANGATILLEAIEELEILGTVLSHPSNDVRLKTSLIQYLRGEIHKLLCTKDAAYQKERKLLKESVVPAITAMTGFAAGKFGCPIALASALASVMVYLPFKIGVVSWCKQYASHKSEMSELEKDELRKVSKI